MPRQSSSRTVFVFEFQLPERRKLIGYRWLALTAPWKSVDGIQYHVVSTGYAPG
jgi:hypothetical protein